MPSPFTTPSSPVRHPESAVADRGPSNMAPEQAGGFKLNLGLSLLHVCKEKADKKLTM